MSVGAFNVVEDTDKYSVVSESLQTSQSVSRQTGHSWSIAGQGGLN